MSSIISKILWFLSKISNLNSIVYLLVLTCLRLKSFPLWISATFRRRQSHRILFLVNYLHNKSRRALLLVTFPHLW
ncbi:MAG: hypothetical protein EWV55_15600 [Microcystis viridis Mv_BB_P_19951000_S69]|uniref:Uncharacterized protein n=1 Tax=Microcystis viridis Mv_BB_P_19951000_S68D TaxID=2486270 RepID=A0A552I8T1_MICVR|nr:MAG: hypothetical protein EWV55_15600 [Microcystis viridis Mv_BB_P_19951000_S69]TRU72393.1 MAG: hypothetical protein EWV47_15315 [Microcystis viridis Mv_BB_P_19951000_S68]TRU79851.1 MAG: hypothetical protein EWV77_01375 [Microcystis viridis Mv_BB_P_19951000_S68D]TRU88898.1 MAG: hypothetical protein EWV46_04995 [Microcystis viridis Mv_BB_P_19951000_S69D]